MGMKNPCERATKTKHIVLVLVAAISLAPVTYMSLSHSAGTSACAPAPLMALLPAFIFLPYWLALLVPSLLFLLWNGYLLQGRKTVPIRTSVVFFLLILLTILHFIIGWSAGVEYQGISHTRLVCNINILAIAINGLLWFSAIKLKYYITNFAFSWFLFLWLSWQAFPYLGEW